MAVKPLKKLPTKRELAAKARAAKKKAYEKAKAVEVAKLAKPIVRRWAGRVNYLQKEKDEIIPEVIYRIKKGDSLYKALRDTPNAPCIVTFRSWIYANPLLIETYTSARMEGYLTFAEDLQEIADNPHQGVSTTTTTGPDGRTVKVTQEDMIEHRKLQIATRKFLLSKFLPKVFGDHLTIGPTTNEAVVENLRAIAAKLPV